MAQTAASNDIELVQTRASVGASGEAYDGATHGESHQEVDGHSLPPYDGGTAAWRMLLSAFVFEALLWGFPLSFGVFQGIYGSIAAEATLLTMYRPLCLLGLVAGSFARTLGGLILTQGVLYGVGFTIFYYPILSMVNEFWIARRGMAYGFICSASGVSGAAMPLCIHFLLQKYGYQTTLRIMAAGLFVLTGPLIPLLKGRVPETASSSSPRTDWTFLKTPLFWTYSVSNLAMGLGYFFPSLYLPTYATSNGLSSTHGVLLLAAMSISQVVGQLSFGYLSDRKLPLNVLTVSSTLVASIAVYTCWGLAHTFGVLLAFALIYGFFGAGYTATWARMGTTISSEPTAAFAVFGLLNLGKGVGDVLAGPIGGALLMKRVEVGSYGTMDFAAVVLFAGSCMFTSAATISLCYVDFSKFRDALRWLH
ncbi:hypothetical protein LTR91_004516 [Friedmanniomyces endolithicus]|uniref:Major facilitator superfamily (MFS) profile domain-containing protein n=1 Tax=Friedmanniomyces endolithicus TaxID=329885 RepID=A0AAN6KVM5_9PEZI|nr:hypothetical protein LTR94_001313 [Friedmanniomyces endolithicus]KAK0800413.1 hypothetical protein LTR59_005681 [Friedmanniomyces endolithicus]KAK0807252.1 hypothetical protein LTR75_006758 [Friedmanniomyces endolithicus]KAK0811621.1 hypothetical protein LTR38_003545 [Friedmanniomyces endolithicus]KAK0863268.1 hypothetical protein LTS02_006649 [Friedmanniomyces endolithicus]